MPLQGKYRDIVTIQQRTDKDIVSTGFTEEWTSVGEFYACVLEGVSSLASFQQQFSALSDYTVEIQDAPQISYGNTRFLWTDQFGNNRILQPDRDPKYFGNSGRTDVFVECSDVASMRREEVPDMTESVNFPPGPDQNREQIFYGNGQSVDFYPPFVILLGTSIVLVGSSYQTRNVHYYEHSDHITFVQPPETGVKITLKAQEG